MMEVFTVIFLPIARYFSSSPSLTLVSNKVDVAPIDDKVTHALYH